ncbi:MAG: hypothetical protein HW416_2642 [Chloroflexi bacterium]|nr:hypothetical protein [Chloroflexota bacterium]
MEATSNRTVQSYTDEGWHDLVHTGPGNLAGRYLRGFWQPVYRASDLPIGRAKPIRMMSEDFTLYRGESGIPHLLDFRCAHRRTQLSTGWVEGEDLRCFFHGWKYNPSGQCIEQPVEPEPFCEKVRIRGYPTEEYLGFVFAYLGEGDPPPLPRFPRLEVDDETVVRTCSSSISDHNLFNTMVTDPTHLQFVHRETYALAGLTPPTAVRCDETDYGHATLVTTRDGHVRVKHFIMPNIAHGRLPAPELGGIDGKSGWREIMSWHVPVDDEHYHGFSIHLIHVSGEARARYLERRSLTNKQTGAPDPNELVRAILRGDMHIEEVNAMWRAGTIPEHVLTSIQDDVARIGMGAVPDLHSERLGRLDVAESVMRQIWMRELRALAEGRPLKQWSQAIDLSVGPEASEAAAAVV